MTTSTCTIHPNHDHIHGEHCGHTAIQHNDHVDYLHDGHLHHPHQNHVDEHVIEISDKNPNECNQQITSTAHVHGSNCGHEAIPHGDHIDYLVDGRLQHPHGDHIDDHGAVTVITTK